MTGAKISAYEIHRADQIEVYALDPRFLEQLGALTDRNARWTLLRNEGVLYITVGAAPLSGEVTKHALTDSSP